ncbi:DUF5074 domain-containing protein [Prevotella stercorea]|uniref:DUF5074 domain-containing protein n=1 Tax=Leyella stercorea TaxID=363265 RepID=UPI001F289485|nr:DUF5074 domain-containing protein [Leyella stercorea]MCF2646155.1 DUF5074 domain-containing protein [Leyella stercorea]
MKKIFTSIVLVLCISVSVLAQTTTINVQGQPRKVNAAVAARIQKAAKAVASTGIDFSKIERWAGEGDCKAALAIKWADGQNDGKTLVWGYRWKSSEKKTGEDLVRAVAKADPAFYVLALSGTSFGTTFGGFGYDIDGNRNIIVTTPKNNEVYPRNGIVYVSSYVFDNCSATDITNDAWNSGWNKGFWSYNVADKAEDALGWSSTGASGRVLTDGCVDAWIFLSGGEPNEYDGNIKYLPATVDYTKGVYIVNEDWYGHRNSTVNFLSKDGTFVYDHVENLGVTACYGTFFGNRFYAISKQDGGYGRISVCDANSTRVIKQIKDIDGKDGRSFCGVDEHKAYVSTAGGIYTLDLDELTVGAAVKNADGGDAKLGECGNMVRLGDYVYATEYGKSLRIIDCNTDRIVATISSANVYSITMSKDGQLWVSTDKGISRVNTETNKLETISLPKGINVPANSNGAWCPDGLCASMQNNVIYWTSVTWNILKVFKYDIDNNEFAKVVDLTTNDADKWKMYSASNLRVDPVTDNLYVSLFKDWGSQDYAVRIYDNKGTQLNEYELTQKNYWFPGMFVFPDVEDPIAGKIEAVNVEENKEVKVDLAKVCSDADNFQAAIVKTVKSVADNNVATATVKNGKLVVTGVKAGNTTVTLNFCSNGISTTATVNVTVTQATGITGTQTSADIREIARFTIDGKRINQPQRGINIVKYSDGTVKKVIVK